MKTMLNKQACAKLFMHTTGVSVCFESVFPILWGGGGGQTVTVFLHAVIFTSGSLMLVGQFSLARPEP